MANIIERKSAPRQGVKVTQKTGGKFVAAMRNLAKKRSASRSKSPLQVGNVLTKKALPKGKATFDSKLAHGDDKVGLTANPEKDNLNPGQQGGSNKKKKGSFR